METNNSAFKLKLGIFISIGLALLIIGIFIIGKQKNLFNPVFKIKASFNNVSGLLVGNNVRFSGINVGTIDQISIINDSTVMVHMLIKQEIQEFIKSDCEAGISSDGLIGDKVITISHGTYDAPVVKDGQQIRSIEPIETDQLMASLQVTAGNAEIITDQLAQIMTKVNEGRGTLGRLIQDTSVAENINQTIKNLKSSSESLDENMDAAKENFLLKPYFKKKKKQAEKRKEEQQEAIEKKEEEEKK
jgi:phospholipid/cholesterol/gamma-HCH transport system substrate-binding protein